MQKNLFLYIVLLGFGVMMFQSSCKKEKLLSNGGNISFSTDTLTFDTVFTTLGSFTTSIKIYNQQNERIKLSSVRIESHNNTYFHLNVNGISGNVVNDIEIAPNDSIYVFATVTIDPNNDNTPFVVEDKLVATLNGKDFSIPMIAYGQNAYFIVDSVLKTQTWKTDKPYVIIHNALVDSNETLTIPAGCRIYVHEDSRLYVSGTLIVNGTKEDSVVFQGDRLDRKYFGYEGYPGEWGGLYFTSYSYDNKLSYTVLKNCGGSTKIGNSTTLPAAIQVDPDLVLNRDQLELNNVIIENSIGYGILSFGGSIKAKNCLVHTCGAQALAAVQGGNYTFENCDFIIYGNNKVSHVDNPTVALLNYFDISETQYYSGDMKASLRNCVIWGSLEDEIFCNKKGAATYDVTLEHCAIKAKEAIPSYVTQINNLINQDPQFEDPYGFDYHLKTGSPLIDAGLTIPSVTIDLEGKTRSVPYDIGCYEKQ